MTTRVTSLVLANTTVASGNYGGLTQIPSLAIDAQGRVTFAANNAVSSISVSSGQVTGLAASATTDTTNASNISSGTLGSARLTGTYSISVSGNAGTVTNGVYTTGTQTLSGTYTFSNTITGSITGNAGTVTNGVVTTGSYADPAWITSLAGSKISGNISGNAGNITAFTINQSVGTSNNVQFASLGVGTAASGTSGEIRATNNITAYFSDERLKTRLGNIENALDKVMALSGFYHEANETAQALGYQVIREVGVSAQEVKKVLPEVVAPAPIDPQYMTVRYERMIPLLIEAIKELKQEINELKSSKH